MTLKDFRHAGHLPTLFSAFLYFDISFMVWVILGALANAILGTIPMSSFEKGLLVAVPILGGAILRPVLGVSTDHFGARKTALVGLTLTLVPLLLGWLWASSFVHLLVVGALLGVAGASFAAALPLASRWYPPQYQGLAMGIAGAGNSGTALATFFGPRLAQMYGWHAVFGLALLPVLLTLVIFALLAKDSPTQPAPLRVTDYGKVLRHRDTWWFCLFYAVTFGGFVGLASFLNIFFRDQYGLSQVECGSFATLCVIAGSFLRPVGGYLADRLGGVRMLILLYTGVGLALTSLGLLPQAWLESSLLAGWMPELWMASALLVLTMALLGMGNGAVFQLVPQRFPKEIGVMTGVVGAAGGVGGFFLPTMLGAVKQQTGTFTTGLIGFALLSFFCAVAVPLVARTWEKVFLVQGERAVLAVSETS